MHIYEYQLEALCKKHHVSCPAQIPERAGRYLFSPYCGFKGFLVPTCDKSKKRKNANQNNSKVITKKERSKNTFLNANGSKDTLYSPFRDGIYCFHRNRTRRKNKNFKKRNTLEMFTEIETVNPKGQSKDERKQKGMELCSKTPLTELSLIGFAIESQEGLIALCCNCANPTTFGVDKFDGDRFICGRCTERQNLYNEIECFNCPKIQLEGEIPFAKIKVYDAEKTGPARFSHIHLCKKCNRIWITNSNTLLSLSTIRQGIRERWRSNKVNSKCYNMFDPTTTTRRRSRKKQSLEEELPETHNPIANQEII
jgi:hypothetical protein